MKKTDKIAQAGLPQAYWRFDVAQVPTWQRNAWLNYEYARSCRTIVESVKAIRAGENDLPQHPAFAVPLAGKYPEFPGKAWVEIDASKRAKRLETIGVDGTYDPFAGDASVPIEFYDINEVLDKVQDGEQCFSDAKEDKVFSMVKINFDHEDDVIVKSFRAWLAKRREELIDRYKDDLVGPEKRNFFDPCSAPMQRGHGVNQSQYRIWFNRLVAFRLLGEMTWEDAADLTEVPPGKALYSEARAWTRAREEAADLMFRFWTAWRHRAFPFLLTPRRLSRQIGLTACAYPFISMAHAWEHGALTSYRQRLREFSRTQSIAYQEIISR